MLERPKKVPLLENRLWFTSSSLLESPYLSLKAHFYFKSSIIFTDIARVANLLIMITFNSINSPSALNWCNSLNICVLPNFCVEILTLNVVVL